MTDHLTIHYPHDRFNGYVLLTDAGGHPYVPEFTRKQDNPYEYVWACMEFMKRMEKTLWSEYTEEKK